MRYFLWTRYQVTEEKLHFVRWRKGENPPDLQPGDLLLLYECQKDKDNSYSAAKAIVACVVVERELTAAEALRHEDSDFVATHASKPLIHLPMNQKQFGVRFEAVRGTALSSTHISGNANA